MKKWFQSTRSVGRKFRSEMESKTNGGASPLVALQLSSRALWTPRDYGALARQGYQKNAIAYRCVRIISEAAASVPLCVRRGQDCVAGDPAARFLGAGGPTDTTHEIMERFYGYLQVSGNAYLEAGLVDGTPVALYALRPDRMQVLRNAQGWVSGWDYQAEGVKRTFPRDMLSGRCSVYHMRLFHPTDDYYGLSPLEASAQAVDIHNEGGRWAKSLLDNSARPSGALIYKGVSGADRLSDEQFDRLKCELEGSHTGASHAGRPLLLEGGLDWKAMSHSPSDMNFTDVRREAAREIALAFGVPPMILGIPGDNTYSNFKEANQAFWRQTIIPLVQKTARGMESWLQPFFGDDLSIIADLDKVSALSEERAVLWDRLSKATFLSDDERRELAGLSQRHDARPEKTGAKNG